REQRVARVDALAVQRDLDLARLPLEHLVGAPVPDLHRPRAVLALGYLAMEVHVLERMVLRPHGQVVFLGRLRQALGHGPRGQHAVALQAQVPVQARRRVLVHDEAGRRIAPLPRTRLLLRRLLVAGLGLPLRLELLRVAAARLAGRFEVAFGAVLLQARAAAARGFLAVAAAGPARAAR